MTQIPLQSQLDQVFTLTRTSRKDKRFSSYMEGQNFYYNPSVPAADFFLSIIAGGTVSTPSPLSFQASGSPWHLMLYVISGEAELSFSENTCHASARSFLLLESVQELSVHTQQTPFSCYLYLLNGTALPSYLQQLGSPEQPYYFHPDISGNLFLNHMAEIKHLLESPIHNVNFYLSKLMIDLLTECVLLSDAVPASDISLPEHVRHMKQLFDREYARNFSLTALEDLLNISKYRLCRDFTKYVGSSPLQYLNHVRLTAAKQLLHETDMTVHAIGEAIGIPNTTHFIHLFTRDTGITPLQFRNTHRRLST